MTDREKIIQAVMDVLYPYKAHFGKRGPIFEWGHETTPTESEIRELAEEIADKLKEP